MAVGKEGVPRGRKKVAVEDPPVDVAVSSGEEAVMEGGLAQAVSTPGDATEAHAVSPAQPAVPVDLTPREKRAGLRGAVERVAGKVYEDAPAPSTAPDERGRMKEAEKKYLTAYKELEQKRTLLNRLVHSKNLAEETEHVAVLKRAYDESRIEYAKKINQGVGTVASQEKPLDKSGFEIRMRTQYEKLQSTGELSKDTTFETFLGKERVERQNRVSGYLQFREVVRPYMQQKYEARREAVAVRDREGALSKSLQWVARQNEKQEKMFGKNGARAIRALAGAALVAGTAASGGWVIAATLGGIQFARILASGAVIAVTAKTVGDVYEKMIGKGAQEFAKYEVVHGNDDAKSGISGLAQLERLDKRAESIIGRADEETLKKKKATVQALTALGLGVGTAGVLASLELSETAVSAVENIGDVSDAPQAAVSTIGASDSNPVPNSSPEQTAPLASSDTETTPVSTEATPETTPTETTGPVGEPIVPVVTVGQGEGFNHLFARLAVSGVENPSAVVTYLAETPASEISERITALSESGSALVHPGDQLFLDQNQNLYFLRPGEEPRLLMENTGNPAEPIKFNSVGLELRPTGVVGSATEVSATGGVVELASIETATQTQEVAAGVSSESAGDSPEPYLPITDPDTTPSGPVSISEFTGTDQSTENPQSVGQVDASPPAPVSRGPVPIDTFVAEQNAALADSVITNAYGVEITPEVPAVYVWQVPGTEHALQFVTGGTPAEQSVWAQQYATEHPGSTIHFITPVRDVTGALSYRMDAWDSVQGVPAQLLTDIVPNPRLVELDEYPRPDFQQFTAKLP